MSYAIKSLAQSSHQRDGYDAWWDEIQHRIEFINKEVVTLHRHKADVNQNETRTATPIHMGSAPCLNLSGDDPDDRIEKDPDQGRSHGMTDEIQHLCNHLRSGTPIDPELLREIDCLSDASMSDAGMSDGDEAYESGEKTTKARMDKRKDPGKDRMDPTPDVKVKRRPQSAPTHRNQRAGFGKMEMPQETFVQPQVAITQKVVTKRSQTTCIPMSARSYQVPTQTTVVTDWATPPGGYHSRRAKKYR
ncbi:hypothetical protein LSH36_513g01019 [Paralvinella palmiformis]|uniref:Uncharacterized protein n=1 Tax=Paralvinella palmiformis TaxID=53620 RepID=A0AAD9MY88_9ANNE|nr:hypothetical protein LSH36_513g01019 [Paralvinella palmiformis]